jgi:asparagine synthase (glutamine-hydrolysing)
MCGIAAIYQLDSAKRINRSELSRMCAVMQLRGPDGKGEWISSDHRIGLGHRRLSIIDLSQNANQPMHSADKSISIVFNGEIYNYKEIRERLIKLGRKFRTNSDTEVLIQLYEDKGEDMVHELRGMFAFVLWDNRKNKMIMARDPYGIKPLYYSVSGGVLRVASQVKALKTVGDLSNSLSPAGIVGFFLTGSVPEPHTIYKKIKCLEAGHLLVIQNGRVPQPKPFVTLAHAVNDSLSQFNLNINYSDTLDLVREKLSKSIQCHFVSDVPIAIFLSAGLDSAAIACLTKMLGIKDLDAITLQFKEFEGSVNDEAPLASTLTKQLGIKHHLHSVTQSEFVEEIPRFFELMDQPTIDGVNTYFISKAISGLGYKAAISGVGADELFGGYSFFKHWSLLKKTMSCLKHVPYIKSGLNQMLKSSNFNCILKRPKIRDLMECGDRSSEIYSLYRGLFATSDIARLLDKELVEEGLEELNYYESLEKYIQPKLSNDFFRLSVLESSAYLRNQLLRDADWCGMAHSVEIRTPFVDIELLKEMAPLINHTRQFSGKKLLRDAIKPIVPKEICNRSKTGFGIPMQEWMQKLEDSSSLQRVGLGETQRWHWSKKWALHVFDQHLNDSRLFNKFK